MNSKLLTALACSIVIASSIQPTCRAENSDLTDRTPTATTLAEKILKESNSTILEQQLFFDGDRSRHRNEDSIEVQDLAIQSQHPLVSTVAERIDASHGEPQTQSRLAQFQSPQLQSPQLQSPPLQSSQEAFVEENLRSLRKPITEIGVGLRSMESDVPQDRASLIMDALPTVRVGSLGTVVNVPDRYPICMTHQPLYFEQRNLERCGQTFGFFQNAISGGQFLANTVLLPYRICKNRGGCVVAGGDCLTCQSYPLDCELLPLDTRALLGEAASIAGFSFLFL